MEEPLCNATLTPEEREVVGRFVDLLRRRLGSDLEAVWLFGSRARGERVAELSDIDVLVLTRSAGWHESGPIYEALHEAARELSLPEVAWSFSLHVHDPRWLARRRSIDSFFAAEIDRDRIDLLAAA